MAEGIFSRLREAIFGRTEVEERINDIVNTDTDPRRSMVRFLKMLPSDDKSKKRELEKFFKTVEGLQYTARERFEAYNDLLGPDRNRDTIG